MLLVLPTDHGSADIWDTIFDTSYQLIDAHDHTTGKGVKVPVAALTINADVSWSSSGTSHAITDLNAVDFKAVAAAAVVGLAGALWLNGVDSNLYWRTVGGTNVQLTAGNALNVAAFAGGIGGDYSAVGALELFDDATDSYWFQQQPGGGVRQYARMRSADVDLYEYKANPATGVPTNRVRLASPTSLAASYALTMPPTLPSGTNTVTLRVDSSGVVTASGSPTYYSSGLAVLNSGSGTLTYTEIGTTLTTSAIIILPLTTHVGDSLSLWFIFINKQSTGGTTLAAQMWDLNMATGSAVAVGTISSNSATGPAIITLSNTGLSAIAQTNHSYSLKLTVTGIGGAGDVLLGYNTLD